MHELPWDTAEAHPLLIKLFKDHHAKPGARALDLGCGTGASSRLLAQVGYEVDAWDMSETAIKRARMLSENCGGLIRYFEGNAIKCALKNPDSYELVLDFFFLHHVQTSDIKSYFSGIRHILDGGGMYIVGVFVHDGIPLRRPSMFAAGEVTYWSRLELETCLGNVHCLLQLSGRGGNEYSNFPMRLFKFTL
ncbi:MAG: class I SAM-dependent methyltransferase, partial [Sulfuricurvum sp.]|nr:class I SAM-dependent methyltransferase [Sulfuricurvum sp.]